MRRSTGLLFLLWTGVILVTYYVIQKPGLLNAFAGLADTVWTLLVAGVLLFNSFGLGKRILGILRFETQDAIDFLLLCVGAGLGSLGLLGLFFSIAQLANETILTLLQFALLAFFILHGDYRSLQSHTQALRSNLNLAFSQYGPLTKLAILLPLIVSFLLTLVPPFEAFDAILYHLTLPATILKNGGLQVINSSPFWHPGLSEHVYLWALGMGSERASQILHLAWMVLTALLLWHWATKTWNAEVGRKTLLLLAAIPSLPMLASWAYADMPLVYSAVAAIYAFTRYRLTNVHMWLHVAAVMAGFAMGIKYTSFVVPLTCGLLLLTMRPLGKSILAAAQFSIIALAAAAPWYIRNVIYMGNPFYPFVFGGRYWDAFLAEWYADAGTGIGWDPLQLIMLPLNTTLGTHDVTYFDGRIGPLFLILAPLAIWILWTRRPRSDPAASESLLSIGVFSLLSFLAWTFGVINSAGLWQARLLYPVLFPFAIPTALAWDSLREFDTSRLRISFLVNMLIAFVLALTIFDHSIFVIQRNPLAVAIGAQSRERYIERVNPSYAGLMQIINELPADAYIYSLFEPRSYGLPRAIQADPINYNFAHDVYLYKTQDEILRRWKSQGYTHVLVYERGLRFMVDTAPEKFTPEIQSMLEFTLQQLEFVAQTPDQVYSIYQIP